MLLLSTVIIDVDLLIGVIAVALVALIVLIPEIGIWQRAVAPRVVTNDLPALITDRLKFLRRKAMADLLPYHRLIRPNVIKNGEDRSEISYLAAWRVAGTDIGTLADSEILNTAYQIAGAIGALPSSTTLQIYARRAPHREYDRGLGLSHPISYVLDEMRAQQFLKRERVYHTERTVALTWTPPPIALERMRAAISSGVDAQLRTENDLLDEFQQICETFEQSLSGRTIAIRRLGERRGPNKFGVHHRESELLSFVSGCISGPHVPLQVPPTGTNINDFVATEVIGGEEPRVGEYEVSAISLNGYPDEAVPLMLDRLTTLRISHMLSIKYEPQPIPAVQKEIRSGIADFKGAAEFNKRTYVDPDLARAKDQLVSAIGKASGDYTRLGHVSVTLLVRARTRENVRRAEREIERVMNDCMFRVSIRRMGALGTILSTLPSVNGFDRSRRHLMDALTVAKMFPVHEAGLGRRYAESESLPPNVPALSYALGPGGSMHREHGNVRDVFHRFVIGRPGVGKSVDETYISASFLGRMPNAGVTIIDRGPSAYQAAKMFDGQYYRLLGKNSPGFAMFADAHIPFQAREIFKIIKHMCELSGVVVTPDREESIKDAIRVMGTRPTRERSMLAFYEQLQGDPSLKPALKKYTRIGGDLGTTLDCNEDTFVTGRFNVIDLEAVMDLDPALLIPILETVIWKTRSAVRRMKDLLNAPDLHWRFAVDECNNSLMRHAVGRTFINDMYLMGRKEGFSLSLASNSVKAFAEYPGCSDILGAAQTRIYFNDSSALGQNRRYYEQFELPERGIAMLPDLPDYSYILHQPEAGIMRQLSHRLDRNVLAIIGTSRTAKRVDEYIDRFPADRYGTHRWKIEMLRDSGASEAANLLLSIVSHESPLYEHEGGLVTA